MSLTSGPTAQPSDFFPGLLYVDALELRTGHLNGRWPLDRLLTSIGVGKPVGVELTNGIPAAASFAPPSSWCWFVLDQPGANTAALRTLLADPHVASTPHQ